MEDIIKRILEIEKQQRELIDKSAENKSNTKAIINERINKIKDKYSETALKEINDFEKHERILYEKKLNEKIKQYNEVTERMNKTYKENKKIWIQTMTDNILC